MNGDRCERPECPGEGTLGEAIRRMDARTEAMDGRQERMESKIMRLHSTVHGDGKGEIGLVRKVDRVELRMGVIEKLGWMVVGAVVSSLVIGVSVAVGLR